MKLLRNLLSLLLKGLFIYINKSTDESVGDSCNECDESDSESVDNFVDESSLNHLMNG